MATATLTRVPAQTTRPIDRSTDIDSLARVARCATSNALVETGLRSLDEEWDAERALEAGTAGLMLGGLALAAVGSRAWLAVPGVMGAFLLQHAVRRWCPLLPVLRQLGFRTAAEIGRERYALKAMRGDFAGLGIDRGTGAAERAFRAATPR